MTYIGSSKNIRRRVSSYHQKDDFKEHPTKRALRPHAVYYRVKHKPIKQAKKEEKAHKAAAPFNVSVAGKRKAPVKRKIHGGEDVEIRHTPVRGPSGHVQFRVTKPL